MNSARLVVLSVQDLGKLNDPRLTVNTNQILTLF